MSDRIPARVDLMFKQGATFRHTVAWKDGTGSLINTAGYQGRLQVRADQEDEDPVFAELNNVNFGIQVGKVAEGTPSEYNILIYMVHTYLDDIPDWGKGVYDLEMVDGLGDVWPVMQGFAFMNRNITR